MKLFIAKTFFSKCINKTCCPITERNLRNFTKAESTLLNISENSAPQLKDRKCSTKPSIIESVVGWVASSLSVGLSVPQIYKIMQTRSVRDISWLFPILAVSSSGSWVFYGLMRGDLPLVVCSSVSAALYVVLLGQKIYFARNQEEDSVV